MATMVLASPALSDNGTITTVGSEASDLPAYHLQRMQPSEVWRATDINNAYFTIDLGTSAEYNLISLLHSNADTDTQWRIRAGDTEAEVNGTASYDSGYLNFWPSGAGSTYYDNWTTMHSLHYLDYEDRIQKRWVRIDILNINMDYFEAGRLFIALPWRPSKNLMYGAQFPSFHEEVRRSYSQSGIVYPSIRARYPVASFTVRATRGDMFGPRDPHELGLTRGVSEDVLFVFDPDPDDSSYIVEGMVHGLLDQPAPIMIPARNIYEVTYTIRGLV